LNTQRISNETFKRLAVLAALFSLSLILYLDRAAISSAKTSMATALSLSDAAMGAVFSAFALGYAFAQIPSGWFADRIGPRMALALVVALWSVFTVLTGFASGLGTLLVVRFLLRCG
jgi:ACS family glucarate transporter-like MFS transporter